MKKLPPSLRRFHRRSLLIALLRRMLLWAFLSLGALALWTIFCVLFRLPREWQSAAIMCASSLLPAVFFWPFKRRSFLLPLREHDPESVAESLLEAKGAAIPILSERLSALEGRLSRRAGAFRSVGRGLRGPALFAAASLGTLQLVAFLTFSQPILLWDGGESLVGSGIKLSEIAGSARQDEAKEPSPMVSPRQRSGEANSLASAQDAKRSQSLGSEDTRFRLSTEGRSEATGAKVPEKTDADRSLSRSDASEPSKSQPPPAPAASRAAGDQASSGAPNPGNQGPKDSTGYEGRGASGVPSPLIDYRTRLFKELAAREGRDLRASGDLVTTPLPELQRRWFSSFEQSVDIGPREDAWTSSLRRKWTALLSMSELGK